MMTSTKRGLLAQAAVVCRRFSIVALAAVILPAWAGGDETPIPPPPTQSAFTPNTVFVQAAAADEVTMGTVGATWDIIGDSLRSNWDVYAEASMSRWKSRDDRPSATGALTQIALIPVLRYRFDQGSSPWSIEGGIGATLTTSVYQSEKSRFSTAFNFGDHIGIGYAFGEARRNEVALRVEHFSNGGIKEPNPGKNFIELRYMLHLR